MATIKPSHSWIRTTVESAIRASLPPQGGEKSYECRVVSFPSIFSFELCSFFCLYAKAGRWVTTFGNIESLMFSHTLIRHFLIRTANLWNLGHGSPNWHCRNLEPSETTVSSPIRKLLSSNVLLVA